MENLNVILDISPVGDNPATRTGLARVSWNLAMGLRGRADVELSYAATGSLWALASIANLLDQHPELPRGALPSPALARWVMRRQVSLGASRSLAARISAAALSAASSAINAVRPRIAAKALLHADIFHSTYAGIPRSLRRQRHIKPILTIHDLTPVLFGNDLITPHNRDVFQRILDSLRPEDYVHAVSEHTKSDLVRLTGFPADRVAVIHWAASPDTFHPQGDQAAIAATRAKYQIPDGPYLLSLATLAPHKNMAHLVRCIERLERAGAAGDLRLVLAGRRDYKYARFIEDIARSESARNRIHLTGYVDDGDLGALYSGALAFAFPSLYEGFGLPPLEAMQCGTPVICSNASSLPEVVGDAGILLDPSDQDAWCEAIVALLQNENRRASLAAAGLVRAAGFTWAKTVEQTAALYRQVHAGQG